MDLVDRAIAQALSFQPFASVRQISHMILLSKSMVYWHLTKSLGFHLSSYDGFPMRYRASRKKQGLKNMKNFCGYCYP
jgi:hypothetical protein